MVRRGEIREDLVVELADVIHRLADVDVQHLFAAHEVVERDPDEEGALPDAVTRDDDTDVAAAEAAVDGILEHPERAAFVQLFSMHRRGSYSSSSLAPVPYFLISSS